MLDDHSHAGPLAHQHPPASPFLINVSDDLPPFDRDERVLVYTDGIDFNGEQYFHIRADDLWERNPEEQTEIAATATHWMWPPLPDGHRYQCVEIAQLDQLRAGLCALNRTTDVQQLLNLLDAMQPRRKA